MRVLKIWPLVLLVLSTSVLASPHALTVSAAPAGSSSPVYQVNLDANSVSQTDVSVSPSASQDSSFRIGAVINSSSSAPLAGVYGWQFAITYNSTAFVPQVESGPGSPPYYVGNAALFGSQTTLGSVNWAGRIASMRAIGGSQISRTPFPQFPFTGPGTRKIYVFFALISPETPVSISANTLLASVNFEIVSRPSTPQSFNISDVIFADQLALDLNGLSAGSSAVETIMNEPPHAIFTATPDSSAGSFAYLFNATSSYDPDGTIPNPTGYFWDFGDGTQDLGITGSVVVHDYGVNNSFVPTLRVQDAQGATGAARDNVGDIVLDAQPSHARRVIGPPPLDGPSAALIVSTASPVVDQLLFFNGRSSSDSGGSIEQWFWSFGNGMQVVHPELFQIDGFYYHLPGNYTLTLTVTDNRGYSANATLIVSVHPRPLHDVTLSYLEVQPSRLDSSWKARILMGVTNYGSSNENVTVTIHNNSDIIASLNNLSISAGDLGTPCTACSSGLDLQVNWDTSGIAPGNYTVSATITLPTDPTPSDNTASTPVQILPFQPSTISANSTKASPGDWLVVRGSNFPYHQRDYFGHVQITLDGKQVGYAWTAYDGGFSFLLFIPTMHAGTHLIEAQDAGVGASASLVIHVVPSKATQK